MGLVFSRCGLNVVYVRISAKITKSCRCVGWVIVGTVLYSVIVYDPSVIGGNWIVEGTGVEYSI